MLNLGNLNVKDLFLGSTKVSSAWLGTQKVWPVGSAAPYDYRVQWIETDGIASYIDTGVVVDYSPTTTTKVSMTFQYATMPSGSRGPCVCGARYGTTGVSTAFVITIMDSSTNKRIITFHPSTVSTSPITPIDTDIHTIEMGYPNVLIDGIQVAATDTPTVSYNPRFMIGCGGDPALWSFDNTLYHPANVRVYHCKIINGGNVVFDAFPVVKDGKAGLYDRVSGKVLFNANTTGTITAGPQVPFDNEVEWIQRDVRYIWEKNGSSVTGGYDISEYIPSGATTQNMPQYWLEGSCANTVDMIPVVKDDKMGFYNRVDGKVFLEKQPCLSAGPAIK